MDPTQPPETYDCPICCDTITQQTALFITRCDNAAHLYCNTCMLILDKQHTRECHCPLCRRTLRSHAGSRWMEFGRQQWLHERLEQKRRHPLWDKIQHLKTELIAYIRENKIDTGDPEWDATLNYDTFQPTGHMNTGRLYTTTFTWNMLYVARGVAGLRYAA